MFAANGPTAAHDEFRPSSSLYVDTDQDAYANGGAANEVHLVCDKDYNEAFSPVQGIHLNVSAMNLGIG